MTSTRRFPFAGPDNGFGWSHFATAALREYIFDTDHSAMIAPPVADRVARQVEDIIAYRAQPDRERESRYQPSLLEQINRIKGHAMAGRRDDAARLLENLVPETGDIPDWIVVALIETYRETGRAEALRDLGAMSERFASPLIWEALSRAPGYRKAHMLRACYEASGQARSGALPLTELLARAGEAAQVNTIINALREDPRLQTEAAIAEAVQLGLNGDISAARVTMQTALAAPQAYGGHARWCAIFLARIGAGGEAEAMVASQAARFPDAMNTVRPLVARIARRTAARKARAEAAAARMAGDTPERPRAPAGRAFRLASARARLLRFVRRLRTPRWGQ
jgi:hypothetical protein